MGEHGQRHKKGFRLNEALRRQGSERERKERGSFGEPRAPSGHITKMSELYRAQKLGEGTGSLGTSKV